MDTFPALHQSLLLKNCPYKREGPRGNFCVTLQTLDQRLATRPPIPSYILEMQASLPSNQSFTMGQDCSSRMKITAVTFKQSANKGYRVMVPHTQNLTLVVFFFKVFFRDGCQVSPLIDTHISSVQELFCLISNMADPYETQFEKQLFLVARHHYLKSDVLYIKSIPNGCDFYMPLGYTAW